MPLNVLTVPLRPEDYNVAHRVYRDVRDWGHKSFLNSGPDQVDATLIVWYEDSTGIRIHYESAHAKLITDIKDLRGHLHSASLPHAIPWTIR